jgi:hypothetical protein
MNEEKSSIEFPLPEDLSLLTPKSDLDDFITQVRGDLSFAKVHDEVYPRIFYPGLTKTGEIKYFTLQDRNYQLFLFNLIMVSLVSSFEGFMQTICRKALLKHHNLFGQFDPSISWKQIPSSGSVDEIWEALADQVLSNLESGKLRTFSSAFKKIGAVLPSRRSKRGKALEELIRRRNVIVHNKNVPDKKYLEIVPHPKTYTSGGLVIDIHYIEEACGLLINTSRDIVKQLVKFGTLEASELEERGGEAAE